MKSKIYEMKKIALFATLICGAIVLFTQCKKEDPTPLVEGKKIGEVKLSNAELAIIPYKLNDSITFTDSLGNKHGFKVFSYKANLLRVYKNNGTNTATNYYEIEHLSIRLIDHNNYDIFLGLRAPLPSYCSNQNINKNYFFVGIYPPLNSSISLNNFSGYIDTITFYYSNEGVSIPFYNAISLFNKTFNNVYKLKHTIQSNTTDYIETVFYNKTEGIVSFTTKNGIRWVLDN